VVEPFLLNGGAGQDSHPPLHSLLKIIIRGSKPSRSIQPRILYNKKAVKLIGTLSLS